MNVRQADAMKWFFGSRVTTGQRPSGWVVNGPFGTYGETEAARAAAEASDAGVTPPFAATTTAEAQDKCDSGWTF